MTDRKGTSTYQLFAGDQITAGVTHQIQVGRDNSWVKYEATTKVRPDESTEDAKTRAIGHVNASVMDAVDAVVEEIRNKEAGR